MKRNLTREERRQKNNLIAAVVFWSGILVVCVVVWVMG